MKLLLTLRWRWRIRAIRTPLARARLVRSAQRVATAARIAAVRVAALQAVARRIVRDRRTAQRRRYGDDAIDV